MDRGCCRRRPAAKCGRRGASGPGASGETGGSAAKRARGTPPGHRGASPGRAAAQEDAPASGAAGSGDGEALFEGLRRREVVRLLLQALSDLGFEDAKATLEHESGVTLELECVGVLRKAILEARWTEALAALGLLGLDDAIASSLRFLLLEQRFLETAGQDRELAAACWRDELSPAAFDADSRERLRRAGEYLSCRSLEDLERASGWSLEGSREALWARLVSALPPRLAVPPRRLSTLLWQALRYQQLHCTRQEAEPSCKSLGGRPISLLEDYACEPPTKCTARLDRHSDEVWHAAVSHDGRYIASSSKDKTVVLWECLPPMTFRVVKVLSGHAQPCLQLAWSADDRYLLTASNDRTVRLWAPPSEQPVHVLTKHAEAVTSVGWLRDSRRFVSAGFDKCIFLWHVDGSQLWRWEVHSRVQDLCISCDDSHMLVVDSDRNLKIFDLHSKRELLALPESDAVTSVCASRLREEVLVNIAQQVSSSRSGPVIRLWDLSARRVTQRYVGHCQGRFVVRSCFGGPREEFVFSGSEDARIYIWHRHYGSLLSALSGHGSTVNSVCWTSALYEAGFVACPWLVSASDDRTLRIWAAGPNGPTVEPELQAAPASAAPAESPPEAPAEPEEGEEEDEEQVVPEEEEEAMAVTAATGLARAVGAGAPEEDSEEYSELEESEADEEADYED